jgi:hypothetical protein
LLSCSYFIFCMMMRMMAGFRHAHHQLGSYPPVGYSTVRYIVRVLCTRSTCRLVYVDPTTIEKGALLGACSCTRSKFARACVRALVLSQSPLRRCQPREEVLSARGVMSSRAVVCVRLKFRRSGSQSVCRQNTFVCAPSHFLAPSIKTSRQKPK